MVQALAKPETPAEADVEPYLLPIPLTLKLPDCWASTDEALMELSAINDPWQFELTADRELVIMSPEGRGSSRRGSEILTDVSIWNRKSGDGVVLGAQAGIRLSDSSVLSPDVAWVSSQRWNSQDAEKDESFGQLCPELVVEVVSVTDINSEQQEKMRVWVQNGALLGWLIDPYSETVHIFRPNAEPEELHRPETLSGEDVCVGLEVDLERIWTE